MWIERLDIDGFGCLREVQVDLDQHLTVITGLNESGKSTLHAAILATLFGFFDSGDLRRERLGIEVQNRYEPWDGGRYAAKAIVHRSNGPTVSIRWDFSGRSAFSVSDAVTGEDLTRSFRGGAESVLSARSLAGVSRDFYSKACVVRQGELGALDDDDRTIAKTIEAVASSGRRDASAQRALVVIDGVLKEEIGTDRARTKPLPTVRQRVIDLKRQLDDARAQRVELEGLAAKATEAAQEADEFEANLRDATNALDGHKLADLKERLNEIDGATGRITELNARLEQLRDVASFSTDWEADVVPADGLRREVLTKLEATRKEVAENEELVLRLRDEQRLAEEALAALGAYATAPDSADVQRLVDATARMQTSHVAERSADAVAIPDAPSELLELECQVERDGSELDRLRRSAGKAPGRSPRWVLAGIGSLIAAGASAAGSLLPVAGAFAALAAISFVAWIVTRPRSGPNESQRLEELLGRASEASAARAEFDRTVAEATGRLRERERQAAESRQAEQLAKRELDEILSGCGYEPAQGDEAIRRFKHAAEKRGERIKLQVRVQEVRAELVDATKPENACAALERDLRDLDQKLAAAYERAGIEETNLDLAREAFGSKLVRRRRFDEASNKRQRAEERLAGALSGQTEDNIRLEASTLEARGANPGAADPSLSMSQLDSRRQSLQLSHRDALKEATNLSGQLEGALRGLPEPAALEEELAQASEDVEGLEDARQILELARTALAQAAEEAYRDVAPRLNRALGRALNRITNGRYRDFFVDQEFHVRVESEEAGGLVDADLLSDGTQDQIYLVERLELVRVLGGDEPLPMLLDDPLVYCDEPRRRALAELLDEMASEQQLIILSTHPDIATLLCSASERCTVINLDELQQDRARLRSSVNS